MTNNKSDILIILDIDETLIYATENRLEKEHDFEVGEYLVYKRPYFEEFIDYLERNFNFAVWSSASDSYVEEITKKLDLRDRAKFCWARSKATLKSRLSFDSEGNLKINSLDYHYFVKRLKKVKKLGYKLEKILIIDDSQHKSRENYGNAIYASEYKGDEDDPELLDMIKFLDSIKLVPNVRTIEKRNWKEKIKH